MQVSQRLSTRQSNNHSNANRKVENCQKTVKKKTFLFEISKRRFYRQIFGKFSKDVDINLAYNKLFINQVFFSYWKIFRPWSLCTDLASSIRTQDLGLNILPHEKQTRLIIFGHRFQKFFYSEM